MEDLSKFTPIELNKMINDTKSKHDALKQKIIDETIILDMQILQIQSMTDELTELEKNYVAFIEEMEKR
jgi:hypothetical protein